MQSTLRLSTDPLVYSHFQTLRKRWGLLQRMNKLL